MLAIVCTIFFLGAAALAIGTIVISAMELGPQVSAIRQQARSVPETKDYLVTTFTIPSSLHMADQPLPRARRGVGRAAIRPVPRRNEGSRAAA